MICLFVKQFNIFFFILDCPAISEGDLFARFQCELPVKRNEINIA